MAVWTASLVLFFAVLAAWSLSTPLYGGPDEPAQVVHAVAVVRGQWVGHDVIGPQNAHTSVVIPDVFTHGTGSAACIVDHAFTAPACLSKYTVRSTAPVVAQTYVGRYPPLYYSIVGLPSLVLRSTTGIWAMRLMSALLNSVFLALALATLVRWSRHRLAVMAVLLSATPNVMYIASVVNASGLECTSALALWCAGIVLALEHPTSPPRGLVAVVAFSGSVLALSRGLSPLWVVLILLTVASLLGMSRAGALLASRDGVVAVSVITVSGLLAVWWIVSQHSLDLVAAIHGVKHDSDAAVLRAVLAKSYGYLQQMVGELGWLDTPVPQFTFLFWFVAVGAVAALAVLCAQIRERVVFVALAAAVVLVPLLIQFEQARRVGLVYQGRYTLPLAEGLPLLAAAIIEHRGLLTPVHNRLASGLLVGVLISQVASFGEAVRRYTVGKNGSLEFWHGQWHPPAGSVVSFVWFVVAMAVLVGFVRRLARQSTSSLSPGPERLLSA